MNSIRAYVTDSIDAENLNIELQGVTKVLIRKDNVNVWCMNASVSAKRFFMENTDLGNLNMPVYSIPFSAIADLHLDLMQIPIQIAAPSEPQGVNVITKLPGKTATYTVKKLIEDYIQNGSINVRAGNLIIEIAKDQKITDFRSFIEQNSTVTLKAYKGCGAAVIASIKDLADHFGIDNSHI